MGSIDLKVYVKLLGNDKSYQANKLKVDRSLLCQFVKAPLSSASGSHDSSPSNVTHWPSSSPKYTRALGPGTLQQPPELRIALSSATYSNLNKRATVSFSTATSYTMSVELIPAELGFKRKLYSCPNRPSVSKPTFYSGPFNHEVSETLELRNPNSEPLAFKVGLSSKLENADD